MTSDFRKLTFVCCAFAAACGGRLDELDAGDASADTAHDGSKDASDAGDKDSGGGAADVVVVTLASNQASPFGIAIDDHDVYWTNLGQGDGTVAKCAKSGCGGVPTVLAASQLNPWRIAIDDTDVYWTNRSTGGTLMQCAKTGCGAPNVLGWTDPVLNDITVSTTTVYWTTDQSDFVMDCAKGNCSQTFTSLPGSSEYPQAITSDATNVYWSTSSEVLECAMTNCLAPTVLASAQGNPQGIAVDADNVYWTNYEGDTVMACAIAGCNGSPTVIATSPLVPYAIATDGINVYWSANNSQSIMKCPVAGCVGKPTTLVTLSNGSAGGIAVDATSVYCTVVNTSGAVLKITPK